MSIVLGESQRGISARPYFRGGAVCSRADSGIGSVLANKALDLARYYYQAGKLCQAYSRHMQPEERDG
jgi:hypothetical protein